MTDMLQILKDDINLALNEATIIGFDFDENKRIVCVTFFPIAIQENGTIPEDNRFLFVFRNVGRLAASLTLDNGEPAIIFKPNELADKMDEYRYGSIYGWEFIDNKEGLFETWEDNKSFDLVLNNSFAEQHTVDLFQEDNYSHKSIILRIWFDYIDIFDSNLQKFDMQLFAENGKRGWTKLYKNGWHEEIPLYQKLIFKE